jgi:hypothetical protein
MPFVSKSQQKYLFAKKPKIAKEFAEHTSKEQFKKLPEHVKGAPKIKGRIAKSMKPKIKRGKK